MQSMSAASRKYVVNPVPPVNGSSNPALLQRVMVMSAASAASVPTSTGSGSRVYPTGVFAILYAGLEIFPLGKSICTDGDTADFRP